MESILTRMQDLLSVADGPTVMAHTETMKLTEANLSKKRKNLTRKSRKKLPPSTSNSARQDSRPQDKETRQHTATTNEEQPPNRPQQKKPHQTKSARKVSFKPMPPNTQPHTPMPCLTSHTPHTPTPQANINTHHIQAVTANNNSTRYVPGPTYGYNHALPHPHTLVTPIAPPHPGVIHYTPNPFNFNNAPLHNAHPNFQFMHTLANKLPMHHQPYTTNNHKNQTQPHTIRGPGRHAPLLPTPHNSQNAHTKTYSFQKAGHQHRAGSQIINTTKTPM